MSQNAPETSLIAETTSYDVVVTWTDNQQIHMYVEAVNTFAAISHVMGELREYYRYQTVCGLEAIALPDN